MSEYNFFKGTMPYTRTADYILGCCDGSVFIDLNLNSKGQVYLQRISFDGYGCCEVKFSKPLDQNKSLRLIEEMQKNVINQRIIEHLVLNLISINSDKIWNEALKKV